MRSQKWGPHDGMNDFISREEGFPGGSDGKESAYQCRRCGFDPLGQEDPLEKGMATHPCILA